MARRHTRKRKQRGGDPRAAFAASTKQEHIIHCLSQLKRFAPCIESNHLRAYQFFYNLGRLQELLNETTRPEVWWKPLERLVNDKKYAEISAHIDSLQALIGADYDAPTIEKGC